MIPRSALETKVVEGEGASLCWAMAMAFVNMFVAGSGPGKELFYWLVSRSTC